MPSNYITMSTTLLTILTAIVAASFFRASNLYRVIKGAYYYSNPDKDATSPNGYAGCLAAMYLPSFCLFITLPIFLFFKVDWRIPIFAYIVGSILGNMIGYVLERVLRLPRSQNSENDFFSQDAFELSQDKGMGWRAFVLYRLYILVIHIISIIIFFIV